MEEEIPLKNIQIPRGSLDSAAIVAGSALKGWIPRSICTLSYAACMSGSCCAFLCRFEINDLYCCFLNGLKYFHP